MESENISLYYSTNTFITSKAFNKKIIKRIYDVKRPSFTKFKEQLQ